MRRNSQLQTLTQRIPPAGLAVVGILAVALSAVAEEAVAQDAVDIAPIEAGDTEEIDPKGVAVTSDGTHLTLTFDAGQDVEAYLRSHPASSIAEVWLDTDLDTATGGKPFFSDVGGFDFAAQRVFVCKAFDGGHVCAGDATDVEFTEFFSSYSPQLWDPAIEDFADVLELGWEGGRETIEGNHVTVRIPYEEFDGMAGQTVRLLIIASSYGGSMFPEVQLALR